MEADGTIVRDVRGRRTYGIRLVVDPTDATPSADARPSAPSHADFEAFAEALLAIITKRLAVIDPDNRVRYEELERYRVRLVEDLAAYRTVTRAPVRASFRGREFLSNPPPSSGGVLIALALEMLGRRQMIDVGTTVEVMDSAQRARTPEFLAGLAEEGFVDRFLADRLGSTTHITAVDAAGGCASVTCSNGSGSGLFVEGTGLHVNNMLGEQDLNPFGFHATEPGRRLPSMMSPSVVLRDGELELGLGSGGSNRIRSAITQVVLRVLADGMEVAEAVAAPRVHFEAGAVHAEPGVDEDALDRLAEAGYEVIRWHEPNLFFGGVHAVAVGRGGTAVGAGDPRRGGAVAAV